MSKVNENQTEINDVNNSAILVNIQNKEILKCLQIDDYSRFTTLHGGFDSLEDALEGFKTRAFESVYYCDSSDTWYVYDHIQAGNYKAYSLSNLAEDWEVLAEVNYDFYLITFKDNPKS
ncbi:hypothetical protein [Priestia aryabhattai]